MTRHPLFAWPVLARNTRPPNPSLWQAFRARLSSRGGRFSRAGCLAVFDVSDLPELKHMFGAAAAHHVVARILGVLGALDPWHGKVLRTTPTTFAVVLPTDDARQAHAWVRRALGGSFAIESDWHGEEIVVVPDFLVRALGGPGGSFDVVYEQMRAEIAATQQYEQRRHGHLRREGESRCSASLARRRRATADALAAAC